MYMSNGLPVVSVKIPAVESSKVGEYLYYYEEPDPEKIAQAIRQVPTESGTSVLNKLNALDETFHAELSNMLEAAR